METIFDKINKTRFRISFNLFILTDTAPTSTPGETGKIPSVSEVLEQAKSRDIEHFESEESDPLELVDTETKSENLNPDETESRSPSVRKSAFDNFMNKSKE
jgi:hypothetical protein